MMVKQYEGSICEVKTLKDMLLTSGRIEKIEEDTMEISDAPGPMPIIPYKTPVKIAMYNAVHGFKMMAGQVYISNKEYLKIVDILDFLDYERRQFFRVDIDASAELILPIETDRDETEELNAKIEKLPVRMRNISLCGLMFETDREFKKGDKLTVLMPLYKNSEEELAVVVQRFYERDGKNYYGAEILNLDGRVEQLLCAYLFAQQRMQIQKRKSAT